VHRFHNAQIRQISVGNFFFYERFRNNAGDVPAALQDRIRHDPHQANVSTPIDKAIAAGDKAVPEIAGGFNVQRPRAAAGTGEYANAFSSGAHSSGASLCLTALSAAIFAFDDTFNNATKARLGQTSDTVRNLKYLNQIFRIDALVRPVGDLLQGVLGPQLFDFQSENLGQAGGEFLRRIPLMRRKFQANECDDKLPVDALGGPAPKGAAQAQEQNHGAQIGVKLRRYHDRYSCGSSLSGEIVDFGTSECRNPAPARRVRAATAL
jgi:hypothetical protein